MDKELRAAAERLLHYDEEYTMNRGFLAEGVPLAKNYLAEHPADDDELVTDEWLRSVGFKEEENELRSLSIGHDSIVCWDAYDDALPTFWVRAWELQHIQTRGQVRNLCKALGINLKEGSK